jgi:hypothetical protein
MIAYELDKEQKLLIIRPEGPLSEQDFKTVAGAIDPFIEESGSLAGLVIQAATFPGWQDFAGLVGHLKFVKGHHKQIQKIAAVTDDKLVAIFPKMAGHFVSAEIKHFSSGEFEAAKAWVLESP